MQYHLPCHETGNGATAPVHSRYPPVTYNGLVDRSAPDSLSIAGARGDGGGIAVGRGLLSGRRLAVRVAPPPLASTASVADVNNYHAGDSASGKLATRDSVALHGLAATAPRSPTVTEARYGGGLIRISDLRRQGVQSVESGLHLATLQGIRTAGSTMVSNVREDKAARGGISSADMQMSFTPPCLVDSPSGARRAAPRSARRPAQTSRKARVTRSRTGGKGQRRSSSSSSTDVKLRDDGQLCDHRWFTARGRRCFVYDGRTYKGSSAHRMWERVKAAASRRAQAHPQPSASLGHGSVPSSCVGSEIGRGAKLRPMRSSPSRAAPRAHRASTRARSATDRSLHPRPLCEASGSAASHRNGFPSSQTATATAVTPLREEWRSLMGDLGVLSDESEADEEQVSRLRKTDAASTARGAGSQQQSGTAAGEVFEIEDSNSAAAGTEKSKESCHSTADGDRRLLRNAGRPPESAQLPASLEWPATSFFTDESSGWSSTSSLARSPSPPSSSIMGETHGRKRTRTVQGGDDRHATPPGRLRTYQGVQVVERDGWIYPVGLCTSQQHRMAPPASTTASKEGATTNQTASAESVCSTGFRSFCEEDDTPFADRFVGNPLSCGGAPTSSQEDRADASSMTARSANGSAGLSVVRGDGVAVPMRPTLFGRATLPHAAAAGSLASHGTPSQPLSIHENWSGFDELDLMDMFVTGEELGGLRYNA